MRHEDHLRKVRELETEIAKLKPAKTVSTELPLINKRIALAHLVSMAEEFARWSVETMKNCKQIQADIDEHEKRERAKFFGPAKKKKK